MRFNLSEWSIKNQSIVFFFMVLMAIIGFFSYTQLSQSEDPPFTFKAMVVQTYWPGATAQETSEQVTDEIEKALMSLGTHESIQSYSRPGESMVTYIADDSLQADQIKDIWYNVRKEINDIRPLLPPDVQGPYFNDNYGDTFGNIYVLTGDEFDYATLKAYAERLQLQLQRVPNVGKIELVGLQDEKIWLEISNTKAASLGIPVSAIQQAIEEQNAMQMPGFFETASNRIQIRVSGQFKSVEDIEKMPLLIGDRTVLLGNVATVRRGFSDPAQPKMRFMDKDGIGIAVSMSKGGDILALGKLLDAEFSRLQDTLPLGMRLDKVSDQPAAVKNGVNEFMHVLTEAVVIVLLVSFFSLGMRTGLVVALSIPLVLAMTFAGMNYFDIGLHKISLGALILALGLLVDDAIIAVEMMVIKMEQGYSRLKAAGYAWSSTAFPMLTGTLITAAGFLPIATASSSTGEYTRSIFQVVTLALVVSWIAAVMFVPLIGAKLLPDYTKQQQKLSLFARIKRFFSRDQRSNMNKTDDTAVSTPIEKVAAHDPYQSRFYRGFRKVISWCIRFRKTVILLTLAIFCVSVFAMKFVPKQFFPPSNRPEILIDIKLEEGASLKATETAAYKVEQFLKQQQGIDNYVAYVGTGSPRFYLPLDQQLPQASFTQFVVLADSIQHRDQLRSDLEEQMKVLLPAARTRVALLENGPPVGYPLQYRISGENIEDVKMWANETADVLKANSNTTNVHLNWGELSQKIYLDVDQERARQLGVSSKSLSEFLQGSLSGTVLNYYREKNELIEIRMRGDEQERLQVESLSSLAVPTQNGNTVPLDQIAKIRSEFEDGVIWHRDRLPTITVRADVKNPELQPATVADQLADGIEQIRQQMPSGYLLELGGTVEESAKGQGSVNAGLPLLGVVVFILLMVQLGSFSRSLIVFLTAPLGIIGVIAFLLLFNKPFGFVAMLGTIALSGMIMRNSLILVDQIEKDVASGLTLWNAIIEATTRRFRPIILTAAAAVLAMIPLSRSIFFGPMAVAIMGGLIVATLLTLFFLPALYAAWYKATPDDDPNAPAGDGRKPNDSGPNSTGSDQANENHASDHASVYPS